MKVDIRIIELTKEEFYALYQKCQENLNVTYSPGETAGMSQEERKAYIHEKLNPPIPLFIDEHTSEGINRYIRKRKQKAA